ncbi:hypothetical protein ACSBR2_014336 [Camellia fascicularis]
MGFNHTLNLYTILILLLLFISSSSYASPSSSHEVNANPPSTIPSQNREFLIKHTSPFMLSKQEHTKKKKSMERRTMKRKKTKNFNSRAFSAMLPKGFVPPSGSSSCHNGNPNSVTLDCYFSNPQP